jgi:hypothetical protein
MTAEEIVNHVLCGANDINVVIGPLRWQPSDGASGKEWYFIVATSEKGRGFRCDAVFGDAEARTTLIAAFIPHRPLVIHDMADELDMARLCETLWPGERITRIRKGIEVERGIRPLTPVEAE